MLKVVKIFNMAALVIRSLNILLGIFFTFLGILKITPNISKDLHKDLRSEYAKFARVFPGAKLAGVKLPSKWYRRSVGVIEIVCGKKNKKKLYNNRVLQKLCSKSMIDKQKPTQLLRR